jgi:hypothetical protein
MMHTVKQQKNLLTGIFQREKLIPHSFSLAMTLGCISVDTTFRICRYWCAKNPMLTHGVPLCDVKAGVWMIAIEIIVSISFCDHNSHQLVTHGLDTISCNTGLITKEHISFQQHNASAPSKPFPAPY